MVVNDRVAELIRENETEALPSAIKDGTYYDMQTLTQALIDLTMANLIDREEAAAAAPNRHDFLLLLGLAEKVRVVELAEAAAAPGIAHQAGSPENDAGEPSVPVPGPPPREVHAPVSLPTPHG